MANFSDDAKEIRDRRKVLETYGMPPTEVVTALNCEFDDWLFCLKQNGDITAERTDALYPTAWTL